MPTRATSGGLWRALAKPTSSQSLGGAILGVWLLVHALILIRAALPELGLGHGPYPWHMFSRASSHEMSFRADARAAEGPWVSLPVERVFDYRRGATDLRVYDDARQFFAGGHRQEREEFARFLAVELAPWLPPGTVEIRLRFHLQHRDTGAVHYSELGRFAVAAP